jgi:hypothetical protein
MPHLYYVGISFTCRIPCRLTLAVVNDLGFGMETPLSIPIYVTAEAAETAARLKFRLVK